MIQRLRAVQPNMSVSQQKMTCAMALVMNNVNWFLPPEQQEDWRQTCSMRLRVMLRHVAQAECKQPPPKWFTELFGKDRAAAKGSQLRAKSARKHM
eukprot:13388917-Alexandrium_andersonii.AAC.1